MQHQSAWHSDGPTTVTPAAAGRRPHRARWPLGAMLKRRLSDVKCLSSSVRAFMFDVVRAVGKEKHSGEPLQTVFIGHVGGEVPRFGRYYTRREAWEKQDNFAFIMDLIYSNFRIAEHRERICGWHIPRLAQQYRHQADLLFIDAEPLSTIRLDKSRYLAMPPWVHQQLRLADGGADVFASIPHKLGKDIRRILRQGYRVERAVSDRQFDHFYHHMYLPYTRRRFGEAADIRPKSWIRRIYQQGELLFLFLQDKLLLASLNKFTHDRFLLVLTVASEDLPTARFRGASEAIDYFSISSAFEKGYRLVDFLISRPLLNDGPFRYKRKWGTRLVTFYRPIPDIYFKVLQLNDGTRSYLARNPLVIKTPAGFRGRVFFDQPPDIEDLSAAAKRYQTNGMVGLDIFCEGVRGMGTEPESVPAVPGARIIDIRRLSDPAAALSSA